MAYPLRAGASASDAPAGAFEAARLRLPSALHSWAADLCVAFASLVLLVAGVHRLQSVGAVSHSECSWAITLPCVSAVLLLARAALVRRFDGANGSARPMNRFVRIGLAGALTAVWLSAAFVFTFIAPFLDVGNGYFASWAGLACAMRLLADDVAAEQ